MLNFEHIETVSEALVGGATGVRDTVLVTEGGLTFLYALSTGETAVLTSYRVDAEGGLTPLNAVEIEFDAHTSPNPSLAVLDVGGLSLTGLGDGLEVTINVTDSGALGAIVSVTEHTDGPGTFTDVFIVWDAVGVSDIAFAVNANTNTLESYSLQGEFLQNQIDLLDAAQGFWVSAPMDVEGVVVGDATFAVVASAGSSSLTVVQVDEGGEMSITDHLVDSRDTRFGGAQELAIVEIGGRVFVVAAGSDDGLSLFELLPTGRLLHLATIEDQLDTTLNNVSSIDVQVQGNALLVFVGSQNETGITSYRVDMFEHGDLLVGTDGNDHHIGGVGADVFVDTLGSDTFEGGAGADMFVVLGDREVNYIADFEVGVDMLDLSGWAYFRDFAEVTVNVMNNGARLIYGGEELRIFSAFGAPITWEELDAAVTTGTNRTLSTWQFPDVDPDPDPNEENGPRTLMGTAGADSIVGNSMEDLISGLESADFLSGLGGSDSIFGGGGEDVINGNADSDYLAGGEGNDILFGGIGWDTIYGDEGDDQLKGSDGYDQLFGGDGGDVITGNNGNDRLYGGRDSDDLRGGLGIDHLYGGASDDDLFGEAGADVLFGDSGDDNLFGNAGFDDLYGGAENDVLEGGFSPDQLFGGTGNDALSGGDGADSLYGDAGYDTLFGNAGADHLFGGDGDDVVEGGINHDIIEGDNGDDVLRGENGFDHLFGGDGNDILFGGFGDDVVSGGAGDDVVFGGLGADTFIFTGGNDQIRGFESNLDSVQIYLVGWAEDVIDFQSLVDVHSWTDSGSLLLVFGLEDTLEFSGNVSLEKVWLALDWG